jgi:hypothetical protein
MVQLVDVNNAKEVGRSKKFGTPNTGEAPRGQMTTGNSNVAPISKQAAQAIVNYYQTALQTYITQFNIRPQMVQRDLAYYRETDFTASQMRAKTANAMGDASKVQNVTMPIVMPQVESALAYLAGVFLTGYPIFGIVAPPDQQEQIAPLEAIIADNSFKFGWAQELLKTLRNGLKYDLGACEVTWEVVKGNRVGTPDIKQITTGSVQEIMYSGNRIKDLDPYNVILDTRVSPDRNHIEGEFAGYTEIVSPVNMKQRMENLDPLSSMNYTEAFNSPSTGAETGNQTAGFFTPMINPDALLPAAQNQPFSWNSFFAVGNQDRSRINYQSSYEWTVLYLRCIPNILGIRTTNANKVQIWKFIIVNRAVCIYAEPQKNAHGYLPVIVCKPSNDGMKWQSKSFAQNSEPYQYVASALVNSAIESQRRKVYDRIFYDASRINKKDIDNVSSVARIPVKNSQYSKDIASAVHISPYRDEGVSDILQFANNVTNMADIAAGQNRVQQGQFQKGNKTKQEFDTTMSNSNARQQMTAIALEGSFWTPIKEIIKSNMLQFQPAGKVMNPKEGSQVEVDPVKVRASGFNFKVSDGLLPSAKLADSGLFGNILQAAQVMPEIRAEYDLMGMIDYQFSLEGADWLSNFKRSPADAQAQMQMMQQAAMAAGTHKASDPNQAARPAVPGAAAQ